MYAKKSLGQHFLKSERALMTIIDASKLTQEDVVLEIGPGQGALTERLLERAGRVIAVEKDDTLYKFLRDKFQKEIVNKKLILIHDDILNFEFESYQLEPSTYKLVANIPYNITGAILKKFLSASEAPELMTLLVQKEVAERIVARDNKESILSISVKAYGTPYYIEKVLAGSFAPAPNVDSAIITVDNISKKFFQHFSEDAFFDLLHKGFASKRKKLSSNLSSFGKERVEGVWQTLRLDTNIRAEDISVETWQQIAEKLL